MTTEEQKPVFTNLDRDTGRIDFDEFRKYYKLSSATTRLILKQLDYQVIREGGKQFIVGDNKYDVSNSYYLKHAVFEYRKTMGLIRTLTGDFVEYEVDAPGGVVGIGVSHIDDEKVVEPVSPSIRTEPNKQSKTQMVPVNRGAELMMRKGRAPSPVITQSVQPSISSSDGLQTLLTLLSEVQRGSVPPDPLSPQRTLQEAETNQFLITTEQLGQLLGMSKGTISSKKSGFRKLGFEYEKVKEGNTTLWRVKRY
jgi:hypothetical protein